MKRKNIHADLTVAKVQKRWPQTISVFRKYATACIGCTFAPFCTLAEVATEFQFDIDRLLIDLQASIEP